MAPTLGSISAARRRRRRGPLPAHLVPPPAV